MTTADQGGPLMIGAEILSRAERILTDRGADGLEGTGLLAFRPDAGAIERAVTFIVPDQVAERGQLGCWVKVTERGKRELATRLPAGCRYLARLHSHPGEAFHSATDDANPAITFEGAISIVVPFFGLGLRRGLDACAVFRLSRGRWLPLAPGARRDRWVMTVE